MINIRRKFHICPFWNEPCEEYRPCISVLVLILLWLILFKSYGYPVILSHKNSDKRKLIFKKGIIPPLIWIWRISVIRNYKVYILKTSMFYYICLFYLKSTDIKEHLISLYCNDDDQLFQPAIQEIIGNIAFEVCPNPCFLIVTLKPVIIKFQFVKENRYNYYVTQYFTLYSNIPFKWQ